MKHLSINIGRVVQMLFIALVCIFIIWFIAEGRYWSYAPSLPDARKVAENIVKSNRGPQDCFKITQLLESYPSLGEKRFYCVLSYAKLTKDPSACELLMPSSYGWDCLGAATDHRLCIIGEGPENTVRGQGKVTTYNECLSGDQEIRNYSCCVMARILTEDNTQDQCQSLASPELRDECHYFLARKTIENAECAFIENSTTRTACEVAVRALNARTQ